jgi:hypothetical protein
MLLNIPAKNLDKILARIFHDLADLANVGKNLARFLARFLRDFFEISCKKLAKILQDFSITVYIF